MTTALELALENILGTGALLTVNPQTKENRQGTIDPEQDAHGMVQPRTCLTNAIFRDVNQDSSERDHPCRNEQALGRMQEGGLESMRIEVESTRDHNNVEGEQDQIEDEEYAADSVEAIEPVWYVVDDIRHATRGHLVRMLAHMWKPSKEEAYRHGEPSPCEMPYALLESQVVHVMVNMLSFHQLCTDRVKGQIPPWVQWSLRVC